jgi:hypothetical protein
MPTQPQDGADRRIQLAADRTVFAAQRTYTALSGPASPRWPGSGPLTVRSSRRACPARQAYAQIVHDRDHARNAPGDVLGPAPGLRVSTVSASVTSPRVTLTWICSAWPGSSAASLSLTSPWKRSSSPS